MDNELLRSEPSSDHDKIEHGYIEPFTGLPTDDRSIETRRPIAVKIGNNDSKSRPQVGLASADIVFELLIESFRTRFLAVYHTDIPVRIGPVRSTRTSDFDLLNGLGMPYFVSSGGNKKVVKEMNSVARQGIMINGSASGTRAYYERDKDRRAPYNLFFVYPRTENTSDPETPVFEPSTDQPLQPIFEYSSDATASDTTSDAPITSDAVGLRVSYKQPSGADAVHIWDESVGGWVRIQDGSLHISETDSGIVEIAPTNVLVLSVSYERSKADRISPHVLSYGTGEAWLMTQGRITQAFWERTEENPEFRIVDEDGAVLTLTPGSTWVLLANRSGPYAVAQIQTVPADEGRELLAEARASRLDGS